MVNYLENWYRLLVYLTSFTVCYGDIKKALKMTSYLKKKKALKKTS